MQELYYIEADGGVFLVEENNKRTLPSSVSQIPFDICVKNRIVIDDAVVHYATPVGFTFQPDWPVKDDLIGDDSVDSIVQKTVRKTLPNVFTGAIVPKQGNDDEILLVRPLRGYAKGRWILPGGFLQYAEDPAVAVVRETEEETGLVVVVRDILPVYSSCCGKTSRFSIGLAYVCDKKSGVLKLKEDEIEEAKYMPVSDALGIVNHFTLFAVQKFVEVKK